MPRAAEEPRSPVTAAARRRRRERVAHVAKAWPGATVTFAVAVVAAGCGAVHAGSTPTGGALAPQSSAAATSPPAVEPAPRQAAPAPPRSHRARTARGPSPATLPQTHRLPSSHTHQFIAEMRALWGAIRIGSARAGLAAFFPEGAYAQVKAIPYPAADYGYRLLADYRLDLAAAHALLGSRARTARLVAVRVPSAHWVEPRVCHNRVGYYEVPNSRLIYRIGGEIRSLGIASMISWRGIWYVIHLGAVERRAAVGIIDAPSSGAGSSMPSSTC